jgi:hypothetical protein
VISGVEVKAIVRRRVGEMGMLLIFANGLHVIGRFLSAADEFVRDHSRCCGGRGRALGGCDRGQPTSHKMHPARRKHRVLATGRTFEECLFRLGWLPPRPRVGHA